MKKLISEKELNFLESELNYCEEYHLIDKSTKNQILDCYETNINIDYFKIIITVGITFMGLSV